MCAVTDQARNPHHNRENTLLHLSGIFGTEDNHLHALEVDLDRGSGGHTSSETVGRELPGVVDDEIWLAKVLKLSFGRSDQHVVHEEGMVGSCADDPNFDAVLGIPLKPNTPAKKRPDN